VVVVVVRSRERVAGEEGGRRVGVVGVRRSGSPDDLSGGNRGGGEGGAAEHCAAPNQLTVPPETKRGQVTEIKPVGLAHLQ
jgi:hypothetical protein